MKLCVLGSGSEGNATLVHSDSTALLVDAGFSAKELERRLKMAAFSAADLDGILISHEHTDHIRGAAVLARRYNIPVHLTNGTVNPALRRGSLKSEGIKKVAIASEEPFTIGDIEVEPFGIPHDAAEPVAFMLCHNERRALVLTDIGSVTVRAVEKTRKANLAVVEANHDPELLITGPYPWHLKRRIGGKLGHLSNDDCAELLEHAGGNNLETVIFAHLSKINNNADIVRATAATVFNGNGVNIEIASQHEPGKIHEV